MRKWLVLLVLLLLPLAADAQEAKLPGYSLRIVEANLAGRLEDAVKARDSLQDEIDTLAAHNNVIIWFHRYPDAPVAAAPVIVIECPDEFMPKLRQLPGYVRDYPAPATPPGLASERINP